MSQSRMRPYRDADFPAVERIRASAFEPVFASLRAQLGEPLATLALAALEAEQKAHLETIVAPASPWMVELAEDDGGIVAFCAWSCDQTTGIGEIGLNAVRPQSQGKGVARTLYARVMDRMRSLGMRVVTVSTGCDPGHAPARRAYAQCGFEAGIPTIHLYREL